MRLSSALASLTIVALVATLIVRPDVVIWMLLSGCIPGFILFSHHILTEFFDWILWERWREK